MLALNTLGVLYILEKGNTVLDAGCGPGRITISLAALGMDVTGVDIIQSELNAAQESADDEGLHITLVKKDLRYQTAASLRLRRKSFYFVRVLQHNKRRFFHSKEYCTRRKKRRNIHTGNYLPGNCNPVFYRRRRLRTERS